MSDPQPPQATPEPEPAPDVAAPDPPDESPAEAPPATAGPVQPVRVDNMSRRSGDDALEGGWVLVVDGPHKGVVGAFVNVDSYDESTGYPKTILLRARDHNGPVDLAVVDYADCRPATPYVGGR